jgi:hypothetical protein
MRRRWFLATAEACREMPVEAASETIATSFLPCRAQQGRECRLEDQKHVFLCASRQAFPVAAAKTNNHQGAELPSRPTNAHP